MSALVGEGSVFAPTQSSYFCLAAVLMLKLINMLFTGEGSNLAPAPGNAAFGF